MAEGTVVLGGAYPPNIEDIKKVFTLPKIVIFTYGNAIYNPANVPIDLALMAHEQTHSIQQEKDGPEKWWKKYLIDKDFRLAQEVQAYQVQYRYYCNEVKDRNRRYRFLNSIAGDLASEMYGNIISKSEAIKVIKI